MPKTNGAPRRRKQGFQPRVVQYVSWRDGRPRFIPDQVLRDLGFKGRDLRHGADGPWFTMDEAREWGLSNLQAVRAARDGKLKVDTARPVVAHNRSVMALLRDYMLSPELASQAENTRLIKHKLEGYILREKGSEALSLFALCPAAFIEAADVKGLFDRARAQRGLGTARHMVMLLSAAYKWGRLSPGWRLRGGNPCHQLGLAVPEPRVFVWTTAAIQLMVRTADDEGLPFIGDAIYLGVFSGQRKADRLKMLRADLERELMFFRQNKTGAVVEIPQLAALERRMQAAMERRRALPFEVAALNIIVNERTGEQLKSNWYDKLFRLVRDKAAARALADGDAALSAHVAQARDQDLRDTLVTWLWLAECDLDLIAAITGHTRSSILTTIKHYLAVDRDAPRRAMEKLQIWMDREGMAL